MENRGLNGRLGELAAIAVAAGEAVLDLYHSARDLRVDWKADDSPLTEADRRAHELIVRELGRLTPVLPVLSEESEAVPAAVRRAWRRYWLVDPLDGTKEFIKRNGEFTVNIAEVEDGAPRRGVVYVPVSDVVYAGEVGAGDGDDGCGDEGEGEGGSGGKEDVGESAERDAGEGDDSGAWVCLPDCAPRPIRARPLQRGRPLLMVASRSHRDDPSLDRISARLQSAFGPVERRHIGSSLKICLLAEGQADFYPRLLPTSEWDTAAAHAILHAAGGQITDTAFAPLTYNQKDSLLNPSFLALADPTAPWPDLIGPALG